MSLRKKTVIIIGVTVVALVVILYAASELILLRTLSKVEEKIAYDSLAHAVKALEAEEQQLDKATAERASQSETHTLLSGNERGEGESEDAASTSNLATSGFVQIRFNVLVVADPQGKVILRKAFDLGTEQEVAFPKGLDTHLTPEGLMKKGRFPAPAKGILVIPEGPLLVSSRPMYVSEEEGPFLGWLVLGRFLAGRELERLSEATHLSIELFMLNDPKAPEDIRSTGPTLIGKGKSRRTVRPISSSELGGYYVCDDIYGHPALVLRVKMKREFYKEGSSSVRFFVICLFALAVAAGMVIVLLLEEVILSRLGKLCFMLRSIGMRGDLAVRVPVTGNDEISSLARAINEMLEDLELSQQKLAASEERFRDISYSMADCIWESDATGTYTYCSEKVEVILGYPPSELLGKTPFDFMLPPEAERTRKLFQEAVAQKQPLKDLENLRLRKDGRVIWVLTNAVPVCDAQGNVTGYRGVDKDITEHKRAERALADERNLLRTLINNLPDFIFFKDKDGRFVISNTAHLAMLGAKTQEEVVGKTDADFFPKALAEQYQADEQKIMESGQPVVGRQEPVVDREGKQRWFSTTKVPLRNSQGKIIGLVGMSRDITDIKRAEEQLRALSLVDQLTGLYNRRGFATLAEQQWKVAHRSKREMFLFYIDLDNMKGINDILGHGEGDMALVDTATLLKKSFRESDIIARMGGDEFVVLAIEPANETPEGLVSRLQAAVDEFNKQQLRSYELSISVGVARYDPLSPCSVDELLGQADALMYKVKRAKHSRSS